MGMLLNIYAFLNYIFKQDKIRCIIVFQFESF